MAKPDESTITLDDLAWLLIRMNKKLNMLVVAQGMEDKLNALREQLAGPTEALRQAVEANQPKIYQGEKTNGKPGIN